MGLRNRRWRSRGRFRDTRHWVHGLFKVGAGGKLGYVDYSIISLIVVYVSAVMLETVDPLYGAYQWEFLVFEAVSVAIFTVEYLGRIWSATEHVDYQRPICNPAPDPDVDPALQQVVVLLPRSGR